MLKRLSTVGVIGIAVFIAGCAPSHVSMNPNYDISRIKRVAVLEFEPIEGLPGSSSALTGIFEKYLLSSGFQIVERAKVQKLLAEQHFQLSGVVDPSMAVSLGKILGVDALLMGSVTVFKDSTKGIYLVDTVTTRHEPVITHKTRDTVVDGETKTQEVEEVSGYTTTREATQVPQSYTIQAEVAAVVRMIDTTTGEIIWVGNAMEDGVDTQSASEYVAQSIMGDWKKIMKQNAAAKAKSAKS